MLNSFNTEERVQLNVQTPLVLLWQVASTTGRTTTKASRFQSKSPAWIALVARAPCVVTYRSVRTFTPCIRHLSAASSLKGKGPAVPNCIVVSVSLYRSFAESQLNRSISRLTDGFHHLIADKYSENAVARKDPSGRISVWKLRDDVRKRLVKQLSRSATDKQGKSNHLFNQFGVF